jgi:hypothetical protein
LAPTVKSGGADPFRFHLYFRHPALETVAMKTPWNSPDDHGKLELRGGKGLVVLPPSLHKSGRRYAWVKGRSFDDMALPELPDVLLEALEAALKPPMEETSPAADTIGNKTSDNKTAGDVDFDGYHVAPSTARFLSGRYSESNGWNQRLFRAGCDLNARGVPRAKADKLLLAGAKPKTADDEQAARDTIASAYSTSRSPSLY